MIVFQYVRTERLDGTVPHRAVVMYPDWRIRCPASRVTRPPDSVTVRLNGRELTATRTQTNVRYTVVLSTGVTNIIIEDITVFKVRVY